MRFKPFPELMRLGGIKCLYGEGRMCLHASFPQKYTSRAVELLSDIAINPVFPSDELNKEKEIILDEINSYLDSPL